MFWFWLGPTVGFVYVMVKNVLTYRASVKATKLIRLSSNWESLSEEYDVVRSYTKNVLHPFKWTFKQMFPGLQDTINRRG